MNWFWHRRGDAVQQQQIEESKERVINENRERLLRAIEDSKRITALLAELATGSQENGGHRRPA